MREDAVGLDLRHAAATRSSPAVRYSPTPGSRSRAAAGGCSARYLKNGIVVQVASRSEFASRETFRRAILALPLEFHLDPTPRVRFRTLNGK